MNKRDYEGKQRFSIRKLTIGVCSVLLSTMLWTVVDNNIVHADANENSSETSTVEVDHDQGSGQSAEAAILEKDTTNVSDKGVQESAVSQTENSATQGETASKNEQKQQSTSTSSVTTPESQANSAQNSTEETENNNSVAGSTTSTAQSNASVPTSSSNASESSKVQENKTSSNQTQNNGENSSSKNAQTANKTTTVNVNKLAKETQNAKLLNESKVDNTQTSSQNDELHQVRTITVKYVNAKTGQPMDGLKPAVAEVYYKRASTTSPWQWVGGNDGYKVISGVWTLPVAWGVVSVKVPTVQGFTAITTGDWEVAKNGTSQVPANRFVHPTWNNTGTSDVGKSSIAYTDEAPVYEALPTHVVYYAPNQTVSRTVSVQYKYWEDGKAGGDVFSPAHATLNFVEHATAYSVKNNTITYGGTPDYSVTDIYAPDGSSWSDLTTNNAIPGQSVSINVPVPTKAGYTAIKTTGNYYNCNVIAAPSSITTDPNVYTNQNDPNWFYRPSRTIFYVKSSEVQNEVNRTIYITSPNGATNRIIQTGTATRKKVNQNDNGVALNSDDTGVVFGDWVPDTTGWGSVSIPSYDGYTPVVTQTVGGNTTTITSIPQETVTNTTLPTVINISYVATATAQLTGNGSATYSGQPITTGDLNNSSTGLSVKVTGPTANRGAYTLKTGDVEFSNDNGKTWSTTLPTNVGTYQVQLTDQGIKAIETNYGGTNIKWTDTNGKSTITSDATFKINPLATNLVLSSNNYSKVYDAQATATVDSSQLSLTTTVNGQPVTLDTTGLDASSYEWVDASGKSIADPVNVGTYYIKLKDSALATLRQNNPNYTLTNPGLATYTITQAQASGTLGGSNSSTYNGQAVTTAQVTNAGKIAVTVNFPGVTDQNKTYTLKDGDYTWSSGSAPTNAGDYTITLTPTGISDVENYIVGIAGKGQDDTSNVTFQDSHFTGSSATYKINKANATAEMGGNYEHTYDGQAAKDSTIAPHITWSATDTSNNTSFDLTHNLGDYTWYTKNASGDYVKMTGTPVDADTYYLVLNNDYLTQLNTDNPNYNFTSASGVFTYTINKANATLHITGSQNSVYDGKPVTIDYSNFPLSVTTDNGQTISLPSGVKLSADDVQITDSQGKGVTDPTNIDTYTITLKPSAINKFESQTNNYNWTPAGTGTLSITRNANVSVKLQGNENVVYTGKTAVITPGSFHVVLGNGKTYTLVDGDLKYVDQTTGANANVGTYDVELSDQGIANIAKVDSANYGYDFSKAGVATVTVTKATPTVTINGTGEKNYDGTPISDYVPTITITAPGDNAVTLTDGDFEWTKDGQTYTTAPSDAGTYQVVLTTTGLDKVKAVNSNNLNWDGVQVSGSATYTINKANAQITLPSTASQITTWTGNPVSFDPSKFVPTITTDNPNAKTIALPSNLQLTAADYQFLQNGQVVTNPTEVGTYQVQLTTTGWQKIRDAITDNANYSWTSQGQGSLVINKATATISLSGSTSMTYNGQPASLTMAGLGTIKITLSNGQEYNPNILTNFEFVDKDGNEIQTPIDVGTYYLKLASAAIGTIGNLDSNHYNYIYDNSLAKFEITKLNQNYMFMGGQTATYTGKQIALVPGDFPISSFDPSGLPFNYFYTPVDGDLTTETTNPTNRGQYLVTLTKQGLEHLQALNPNINFVQAPGNTAYLNILPAQMTISVVGTATSVYDGQAVKFTNQSQLEDLRLVWGGNQTPPDGLNYTLQPVDLTINGGQDAIDAGTYTITLSGNLTSTLNKLFPNYNFTINQQQNLAHYIIYARKGKITLSGTQTTPYGTQTPLNPSEFSIALTDTTDGKALEYDQTLTNGDLTFKDTQYSVTNLPKQSGHYELVPSQRLMDKLKKWNSNYNFGDKPDDSADKINGIQSLAATQGGNSENVDAQHTRGANYVVTSVDAYISLEGSQSVRYNGNAQSINYSKYSVSFGNLQYGENYTYKLQDGDLQWVEVDSNGNVTQVLKKAPVDAGTYHVQLSPQALQNIKNLNSTDYNWLISDNARTAEFTITQLPVQVTISDKATVPSSIYGEQITLSPDDYNISVKTADGTTLNYTPVAGDLRFKNGNPNGTGIFDISLSDAGLQNIEKKFGTKNYIYSSTSTGTYEIKHAQAGIKIVANGTDSKTYDGQAATLSADNYKLEITTNNGQTINIPLNKGDLVFSQGSAPVNVGKYDVTLSSTAFNNIKNEYSNYDWSTPVAGTYSINSATANVNTSGSYEATYNGSTPAINLSKITNTIVTNNGQTLTVPTLSTNDFEWVDKDGNAITDPVNVGTYYLKLKDSSHSKIATNNNYKWTFAGMASVTINPASATITFGGSPSVTYTGNTITPDPSDFTVTLSNGETYKLQAKDIKVIGDPINVGPYKVQLTQDGINDIQATNSNYKFSYDGSEGTLNITQASVAATLKGTWSSTDLSINPAKYTLTVKINGQDQTISGLTADDFIFSQDGHPASLTKAGTYQVALKGDTINSIRDKYPNYKITFNSQATFTLEKSSQIVEFVDGQGTVIQSTTVGGSADSDIKGAQVNMPAIPAGWVAGETIPTQIALKNGTTQYTIKHGTITVNPGEQAPTGPVPGDSSKNYKTMDNLTVSPTRTITVTKPDGTKESVTQTVNFTRTATFDEVTGKATYSDWTFKDSNAADGKADWDAYTPATVAGYTPKPSNVAAETGITATTTNSTIDITYIANDQSGKISYQDEKGNEISSTKLSGKTDAEVTVTPQAPAGWEIVPGQNIPQTVKATANGIPTVVIKIKHKIIQVTPGKPVPAGEKTATGVVIDGAHESDLNKEITRTINVTAPGKPTTTTTQTAKITRTASYDDVTGEVTYGTWTTDSTSWKEFKPTVIPGYTVSQADVPAITVTDETQPTTIDITYTANEQSVIIKFVDDNNNQSQVGQTITKNGTTDQTITDFSDVQVPAHYELAKGQELPKSYKFTADKDQTITIHLVEKTVTVDPTDSATNPDQNDPDWFTKNNLSKTVTRTINDNLPSGAKSEKQNATITRTATYNEVTGKLSNYSAWTKASWASYNVPGVPGYTTKITQTVNGETTTINSIGSVTVTNETQPTTMDITYTANEQKGKISYRDASGKEIGTTPINGKTGETISVTPQAPAGWKIVPDQNIPKKVKATANGVPTVTIKVEHATITVNPGDKVPTGPVPGDPDKNYEQMQNLTVSPTRTITVTKPDGTKETITQTVNFTRTATFDEVTGKATYSDWTFKDSNAADGKADWDAYIPATVAGYTPSQDSVAAETVVTATTSNSKIDITYTANEQTGKISYQDAQGKEIGTTPINGKTGETISVTPQVPAGWKIVNGQDVPKTVTVEPNGVPTVVVKVEHKIIQVQPDKPIPDGEKTDTGVVIDGAHANDLNQTITRTINVTTPDDKTTTTIQTAKITRTASYDDVTGEVTYGTWTTDSTNWTEFKPAVIPGYTVSQADVPAVTVKDGQKDKTISITYSANTQTVTIKFVDDNANGKQVGDIITKNGKTAETIKDLGLTVPPYYQLAKGQALPTNYTFKAENPEIVIHLVEKTMTVDPKDPTTNPSRDGMDWFRKHGLIKTVRRTIDINLPTGFESIPQFATISRTATYNEVTGELSNYSDWNTDSWNAYPLTPVPGYTAHITQNVDGKTTTINSIDKVAVTDQTQPTIITVTYTANEQSADIIYQDENGKTIGTDTVTGKTGETVDVHSTVPAGWKLTDGQSVPATIKFGPTGHDNVVVKVEHATITVTPDSKNVPTGPVPGDPSKNYEKMDNLTVSPTRTINITRPDGTKETITQTVNFTRTATFDEVTGEVTYSDWTFKDSNAQDGKADWNAYTPEAISGYTASLAEVAQQGVNATTANVTINITYVANGNDNPTPPSPEPEGPVTPPTPPTPAKPDNKPNEPAKPNKPSKPTKPSKPNKKTPVKKHEKAKNHINDQRPLNENSNIGTHGESVNGPLKGESMNSPLRNGFIAGPVKGTSVDNSENNENGNGLLNKNGKKVLPQTGEKVENSWVGLLLAGLGIFGLAGDRKRKKKGNK